MPLQYALTVLHDPSPHVVCTKKRMVLGNLWPAEVPPGPETNKLRFKATYAHPYPCFVGDGSASARSSNGGSNRGECHHSRRTSFVQKPLDVGVSVDDFRRRIGNESVRRSASSSHVTPMLHCPRHRFVWCTRAVLRARSARYMPKPVKSEHRPELVSHKA